MMSHARKKSNLGHGARNESGQALVEFALVLPILVLILFGTIEVSLVMNTYVRLNELARNLAKASAQPDMTLSRSPDAVKEAARELLHRSSTLRFLTASDHFQQHPEDFVAIDVNHEVNGRWFSRVEIRYTVDATLLPRTAFGAKMGSWPIRVSCALPNETQGKRRDAAGAYEKKTFFLASFAEALGPARGNQRGRP